MPKKNELHSRKSLAEGRFLRIDELQFTDRRGKNRRWETADRVNSRGAAIIIAEIVPDDTLILVRQFRPPAWQYVIEFPAGLIDPGESAAATAVRELREETGFQLPRHEFRKDGRHPDEGGRFALPRRPAAEFSGGKRGYRNPSRPEKGPA